MTELALFTGRYHSHRAEHGVGVAISLGQPKWPLPYPLDHELRDLMPVGLLGRDLAWPEFERRYLARLDWVGPVRLRRQLEAIAAQYPGEALVLLCWEKPGQRCHRRIAADWLEEHGFGEVDEVVPTPVRLLPVAERDALIRELYAEPAQNPQQPELPLLGHFDSEDEL